MLKKNRKKSYEIWQNHHVCYDPEVKCRITRTEHFFCGRLQPYFKARGISKGMIACFKYWIKNYKLNKESIK